MSEFQSRGKAAAVAVVALAAVVGVVALVTMDDRESLGERWEGEEAPAWAPERGSASVSVSAETRPDKSRDMSAMATLKGRLKRGFEPEVKLQIGDMKGAKAILVGEIWAFLVADSYVCAGNGLAHGFLRDPEFCTPGTDIDSITAAATRTYRWADS